MPDGVLFIIPRWMPDEYCLLYTGGMPDGIFFYYTQEGGCPMIIVYYTQERVARWDIFYYTQEGGCPMSLFIISKSRDA